MADKKPIIVNADGTYERMQTGDTLGVANGGTGATTLTSHGVLIGNGTSAIAATSAGTSGQVLTSNGASSDPTFQTPSGLTGFTATLETSSPNDTVNASYLLASGGSSDQDAVVSPKGTGAFQLNLADGTSTGGDKRGSNAIDLQNSRYVSTAVASGSNAVAIGVANTSSGYGTTCVGVYNTNSGAFSFVTGYNNTNSYDNSSVFGTNTTTFARNGLFHGAETQSNYISLTDLNYSHIFLYKETRFNNTGEQELFTDGNGASGRITVRSNNTYRFDVTVTGRKGDGTCAIFNITGVIENISGTTAILGTNVTTTIINTPSWTIPTVTADNGNSSLKVTVQNSTATDIIWCAIVKIFAVGCYV